jgi:hypothetical protein
MCVVICRGVSVLDRRLRHVIFYVSIFFFILLPFMRSCNAIQSDAIFAI